VLLSISSGMDYICEFLGNVLHQCWIIELSLLYFVTKSLFLKVVCKIIHILLFKIYHALFWAQKKLLLLNTEKE
jgi:hypothetical protein